MLEAGKQTRDWVAKLSGKVAPTTSSAVADIAKRQQLKQKLTPMPQTRSARPVAVEDPDADEGPADYMARIREARGQASKWRNKLDVRSGLVDLGTSEAHRHIGPPEKNWGNGEMICGRRILSRKLRTALQPMVRFRQFCDDSERKFLGVVKIELNAGTSR